MTIMAVWEKTRKIESEINLNETFLNENVIPYDETACYNPRDSQTDSSEIEMQIQINKRFIETHIQIQKW